MVLIQLPYQTVMFNCVGMNAAGHCELYITSHVIACPMVCGEQVENNKETGDAAIATSPTQHSTQHN